MSTNMDGTEDNILRGVGDDADSSKVVLTVTIGHGLT
jgi:hypothetical protein